VFSGNDSLVLVASIIVVICLCVVSLSDPSIVAFLKSRGAAKLSMTDSKECLTSVVPSTIELKTPHSATADIAGQSMETFMN